ncbi:hypothetical protein PM082_019638 [Marasmius tenuissimus]|nr:hypothetical protein PM082_019638 [Marasmius tenuissimus]
MDIDHAVDPPTDPLSQTTPCETTAATSQQSNNDPRDRFYISTFNSTHAGAVTSAPLDIEYQGGLKYEDYAKVVCASEKNLHAPFHSYMDWKIALWAKTRGSTSTAFDDLLAIDGVADALDLSYKNAKELNKIIDAQIPAHRPEFVREEVTIKGKSFDLYKRDVLKCIASLYGDPAHTQYLSFLPNGTIPMPTRLHGFTMIYIQGHGAVETEKPGATVVPVILSTDKTQITLFRNKAAYPVYLTIGNLPKDVRRKPSKQGQILVGYLPTSNLKHIKNKAARRRAVANLFHACMSNILAPLKSAGLDGVVLASGDGVRRRCHPILCAYVGDYPEHVLVTCTYSGTSPICETPADELGNYPCSHPFRNAETALEAMTFVGTDVWTTKCREANIKPVQHPFWEDLPYTNIFRSITPDVLHQLYQGVIKHLIGWITDICGEEDIDARVSRLPPNHGIRVFRKGITSLSRVSGTEHKQMSAFLLSIVTDVHLPNGHSSGALISATRSLLDFLYYARYPLHTEETLQKMELVLADFHHNKHIFLELGVRDDFNIPKLHSLCHYVRAIKLYGTTDNYSTEATERLHIDLAKDAYRATNHKDEFIQMTRWLERREKVLFHRNFHEWCESQANDQCANTMSTTTHVPIPPGTSEVQQSLSAEQQPPRVSFEDLYPTYIQKMTNFPTVESVPIKTLEDVNRGYGATLFTTALARFIIQYRFPNYTPRQVDERAHDVVVPFRGIPVFHKVKFIRSEGVDGDGSETLDSIHAYPSQWSRTGNLSKVARFDAALIKVREVGEHRAAGLHGSGLRLGRVRVIFSLPSTNLDLILPSNLPPPKHLAYVEWFSNFVRNPELHSHLYKIKKEARGDFPLVSVLPLNLIKQSVHLYPKWDPAALAEWESETVLDKCDTFYMSPYKDLRTFFSVH